MPKTKKQVDEHPIIFSEWSTNRILAGEKTQTRRIADYPQFKNCGPDGGWWPVVNTADTPFGNETPVECPYGQPGDVLWVREAFRLPEIYDDMSPREYIDEIAYDRKSYPVRYEADGGGTIKWGLPKGGIVEWGRKRPSIHMPRELCRLHLRVEDVRIERLHEISEDDAMAEGVEPVTRRRTSVHGGTTTSASVAFKKLWKEIHGIGAWEENPWVWVVEFSRINNDN
jgi:hypothetical protein